MTEEEWLTCTDPEAMLALLLPEASERKLRLYVCACFRRRWDSLDEQRKFIVETGEQYSDGLADPDSVKTAQMLAIRNGALQVTWLAVSNHTSRVIGPAMTHEYWLWQEGLEPYCHLFSEIFGNPFRPVTFAPAWRSSDVQLLARGIYDERAFDRLPILADALQDAGCDCDDLLTHLRDPHVTHVRGCWALDLVLGKE